MKTNQHAVEQIIKILEQAVKQIDGLLKHEELACSQVPVKACLSAAPPPIDRESDRAATRFQKS